MNATEESAVERLVVRHFRAYLAVIFELPYKHVRMFWAILGVYLARKRPISSHNLAQILTVTPLFELSGTLMRDISDQIGRFAWHVEALAIEVRDAARPECDDLPLLKVVSVAQAAPQSDSNADAALVTN